MFTEGEENKLEYMPIFQQFQKLFNERIEAFITSQGSTLEQFVEACEKATEESFALQLIMGITSFDAFKELMLDQKRKVRDTDERNSCVDAEATQRARQETRQLLQDSSLILAVCAACVSPQGKYNVAEK